jgi:glutathione S-transferase
MKAIMNKFEIVPVEITHSGMSTPPGKPPGTVPILDIGNGQHIFESSAILEYLEDKFPQAPNMRGTTPEAAARVRELMDVMNEACSFLSVYMHNASKLMEGLEPQSEGAAHVLLDKYHKKLSRLEELADATGPMVADSTGQPTLVDCVAMTTL